MLQLVFKHFSDLNKGYVIEVQENATIGDVKNAIKEKAKIEVVNLLIPPGIFITDNSLDKTSFEQQCQEKLGHFSASHDGFYFNSPVNKLFMFDWDLTCTKEHTNSYPSQKRTRLYIENNLGDILKSKAGNTIKTILDNGHTLAIVTANHDGVFIKLVLTVAFEKASYDVKLLDKIIIKYPSNPLRSRYDVYPLKSGFIKDLFSTVKPTFSYYYDDDEDCINNNNSPHAFKSNYTGNKHIGMVVTDKADYEDHFDHATKNADPIHIPQPNPDSKEEKISLTSSSSGSSTSSPQKIPPLVKEEKEEKTGDQNKKNFPEKEPVIITPNSRLLDTNTTSYQSFNAPSSSSVTNTAVSFFPSAPQTHWQRYYADYYFVGFTALLCGMAGLILALTGVLSPLGVVLGLAGWKLALTATAIGAGIGVVVSAPIVCAANR